MISAEYLAGFFDGEGCIGFMVSYRRNLTHTRRMSAVMQITNTHLPVMLAIHKAWGGVLRKTNSPKYGPRHGMHRVRQTWAWTVTKQEDVVRVLTAVQPYLVVKKEQVDLFLAEYVPTMKMGGRYYFLTDEQYAKRLEVHDKLAAMKRVEYTELPA